MGQIQDIAEDIFATEFYDEVGTPAYIVQRKAQIAAWLETNIGHLNVLINSSFRIDSSGNSNPILKDEEVAIFIQLYLINYYKRESQSLLRKIITSTTTTTSTPITTPSMSDWTELREGDSYIKRVAQSASAQKKVQISQAFKSMSQEAEIKLNDLVHSYNMYKSSPRQVAGKDASAKDCCLFPPTPTP